MTQGLLQRSGRTQLGPQFFMTARRHHDQGRPRFDPARDRIVRGGVASVECEQNIHLREGSVGDRPDLEIQLFEVMLPRNAAAKIDELRARFDPQNARWDGQ